MKQNEMITPGQFESIRRFLFNNFNVQGLDF